MITERDKKVLKWIEKYYAISVKQAQAIFYKNYEVSRRRLQHMEELGILKSYINKYNKEKVYYQQRKRRSHDLFIYDFVKKIYEYNGELKEMKVRDRFLDGQIEADAFIKFQIGKNLCFIILEVDYTHCTDLKKLSLYEKLYKRGDLQKVCYNTFPILLVSAPIVTTKYSSYNIDTIYTSLDFHEADYLLFNTL